MSEQRTKLQLRPSFSMKSEKSPPPGKLFLSHGKPNYTIPRSPKTPKSNPMSPDVNEFEKVVLKRVPSTSSSVNSDTSSSTTTPIQPSSPKSMSPTSTPLGTLRRTKPNLYNGNAPVSIPLSNENEVSRVVLRSTNYGILRNPPLSNGNNAEPEFITRQRKIAGRLARDENSFDIELAKKRSSYTEILSTPTINRTSKNRMSSIELVEETTVTLQNGNNESTIEPLDKAEIIAASAKPSAELVLTENQEESIVQHKPENFHNVIEEIKQSVPQLEPNEDVDVAVVIPETKSNSHNKEEENVTTAKTNGDIIPNGIITNGAEVITNGNGSNFESNTIVSFAKELSAEPNNYPDTVSTSQTIAHTPKDDKERETLEELAKLKFEIEENGQDVTVTQVLRKD